MCGIVGIIGEENLEKKAHVSLEPIVHRGNSSFEIRQLNGAVLGANRLAIVDRPHGHQPLFNEDGSIGVVQNGEIYNYLDLQKELKDKGHNFTTDSDTEVLAHMFEQYGPTFVKRLDSEMFAFVIYDQNKKEVYAARDPLGVKPLYYATDASGKMYFASELKQLVQLSDIKIVKDFPPGHYYYRGQFVLYASLLTSNSITKQAEAIRLLENQLVEAVKKRVQTDLPIGVFLSGGVDSSLIMEIATRFHPDVTAIILGYPGSSDYEFALRLCKDRGYKYHTVVPDVDYEKELDGLIYSLETYEPLIIRQSFALDICSKEARKLGLRIVLVGEGSDELFAGYNEFSSVPDKFINKGCELLTSSLHTGHLQRVDRMSMRHTVELRCPFFDKKVVETALNIDGGLKIKRIDHQLTTKYILRKVAERFLPDYIAWRYKVPFSNGAGMNVGNNYKSQDGEVAKIAISRPKPKLSHANITKYSVKTVEERYYLGKYFEFGFQKLIGGEKRIVVKDVLNQIASSKYKRLVVAEFDRLAIYFPAYLAASAGLYRLHKLDVDFVSTGGDDQTYASLVNNSAQVGLADPMFAMFENKEGVKGEIVGELVNKIPNLAVTINPTVQIGPVSDFAKYRVGTFQEYTTTNSVAKRYLPKETSITPFHFEELIDQLVARKIDIAIVIPEQAEKIIRLGGRQVYDFSSVEQKFLFSGFTIANTLEDQYRPAVRSLLAANREALQVIRKSPKVAFKHFRHLFPEIENAQKVFESYVALWSRTLKVEPEDYGKALQMWRSNYPELLKAYIPYFKKFTVADQMINLMNDREFRRDYPFLEDVLYERIIESKKTKKSLQFIGFWGAGPKAVIDENDIATLAFFKRYIETIQKGTRSKIEITFILSDAHAKMNDYSTIRYNKYLKTIERKMKASGYITLWLSKLWKEWGITPNLVSQTLKNQKRFWWRDVVVAKQLEDQASKQFQGSNKKFGAQQYYTVRRIEKQHLEKQFPRHIFFTYTDSQMQSLLPSLPTLYLYSQKRGTSEVPWFQKSIRKNLPPKLA